MKLATRPSVGFSARANDVAGRNSHVTALDVSLHFHDDRQPLLVLVAVDDLDDVSVVEQRHHLELGHQFFLHQRVVVAQELGRVLVAAVLVNHAPHHAVRTSAHIQQYASGVAGTFFYNGTD